MHLGDQPFTKHSFPGLEKALGKLKTAVEGKPLRARAEVINRALLEQVQAASEPCFLLAPVLEFIERVDQLKLLPRYTFSYFEQWLNQESGLSPQENYRIRGKIAGKYVERGDYQAFFPVGMGKTYEGPHFVTAHKSPDLDTTVASFWGWLDAFAARVSDGLHIWNLPGGPPASQIEIEWIFRDVLGDAVFSHLPKTRTALHISAFELMSQKGVVHKELTASMTDIDHHRDHDIVVLVASNGTYLGDWRNIDVEEVQQTVFALSSCLRWFEHQLQLKQLSLFATEHLTASQVAPALEPLFAMKLADAEPAREFSMKQRRHVDDFLRKALKIGDGLQTSFALLGRELGHLSSVEFPTPHIEGLFDKKGQLTAERPKLFHHLERSVSRLHETILAIRRRLERLDIALRAKTEVFGHRPTFLGTHADLDEIQSKMGAYSSLTVIEGEYPVGAIRTDALRKPVLGTVSLRDFCNRHEMGIPPYLDVISVIDHHKSEIATSAPPFALLSDAQSSNTLVAAQAFLINDRYSLLGQSAESVESQLKSAREPRHLQRLLQRKSAAAHEGAFYVHPERERLEYTHFLYAIFDDTDLLTKVTPRDVEVVAELLARLKTLSSGRESEVVSLHDLPRDSSFAKKAAARLLQNEETYSLYRKIYAYREKEVERNMRLAAEAAPSHLFADTKEQNGCCRVGQTKMFHSNVPTLAKQRDALRKAWLEAARTAHKQKPEVDLHLQMISTIVSAEEVYKGKPAAYTHFDELWIWIPEGDVPAEHLRHFLSHFAGAPGVANAGMRVELLGERAAQFAAIFKESFGHASQTTLKSSLSLAVLHFPPGLVNSRKSMITPFLPSVG